MRIIFFIFIGVFIALLLIWRGQIFFFPAKVEKDEVVETTQICDPEEKTEMPETFY